MEKKRRSSFFAVPWALPWRIVARTITAAIRGFFLHSSVWASVRYNIYVLEKNRLWSWTWSFSRLCPLTPLLKCNPSFLGVFLYYYHDCVQKPSFSLFFVLFSGPCLHGSICAIKSILNVSGSACGGLLLLQTLLTDSSISFFFAPAGKVVAATDLYVFIYIQVITRKQFFPIFHLGAFLSRVFVVLIPRLSAVCGKIWYFPSFFWLPYFFPCKTRFSSNSVQSNSSWLNQWYI